MTTPAKVTVVTGGAQGIGLAIARWFLGRQHRVAIWDIDAAVLDRTLGELNDSDRVLGIHCDV
jgi:NAD(P)-dependent dehydrogenase (short-subunit alcohol dehydrogenase family)